MNPPGTGRDALPEGSEPPPPDERRRCDWGGAWRDPIYRAYHDEEWGVPVRDERHLFELLCLEGAQAGLSWSTILHRRAAYRRGFDGFRPEVVAGYGAADVERLLADAGIVRNRAKVAAAIGNAQAVLALHETGTTLADHLWSFVEGRPRINHWSAPGDVPALTGISTAMSRDLKRRGFRFVGPTILYSLMQSAGLVDDHLVDCFRWAEVQQTGWAPARGPAAAWVRERGRAGRTRRPRSPCTARDRLPRC